MELKPDRSSGSAIEFLKSLPEVVCAIDTTTAPKNSIVLECSLRVLARSIGGTFHSLSCFSKDNQFTNEIFYVTVPIVSTPKCHVD